MDSCPHNEKCSLPTTFLPLGHKTRRKADTKEVKSKPGLLSEQTNESAVLGERKS